MLKHTFVSVVVSVGVLTGLLLSASAASAQVGWACSASPAYVTEAAGRTEPLAAGAPGSCTDQALLPERAVAETPSSIELDRPAARAELDPDQAATRLQEVFTEGSAEGVLVRAAGVEVRAARVQTRAITFCTSEGPEVVVSSEITDLRVGGEAVTDPGERVEQLLAPAPGARAKVVLNDDVADAADAAATTRQAARIEIFDADGRPMATVVLGEARVSRFGDVCGAVTPQPAGGSFASCPEGSEITFQGDGSSTCSRSITVAESGPCPPDAERDDTGGCELGVVLDEDAGGSPAGGVLTSLRKAAGRSTCKGSGFGREFAVLGSDGPDKITGSNRSDRVFLDAGDDRLSAGRGNDCAEGGAGADVLSGSTGSDFLFGGEGDDRLDGGPLHDRLFGGEGDDVLVGGSGNDRIEGGPGDDRINLGHGLDRVDAGPGDDVVNAATDTRLRQRITCGPGRDLVRAQFKDLVDDDCERVFRIR